MSTVLAQNLRRVQDRIADACARAGRPMDAVTLVAVTKSVGESTVRELIELGVRHVGENRVEVAAPKIAALGGAVVWHMIGTIQRRKAKDVVRLFQYVDAVDRLELADELAKRAHDHPSPLPVLLEVNVSGESSKHGFSPDDLPRAIEHVARLPQLAVQGLMTMAPFYEDPERTRPVFAALAALARHHNLARISMGMTNDYTVAIEEGATEVRIGSALFESLDE